MGSPSVRQKGLSSCLESEDPDHLSPDQGDPLTARPHLRDQFTEHGPSVSLNVGTGRDLKLFNPQESQTRKQRSPKRPCPGHRGHCVTSGTQELLGFRTPHQPSNQLWTKSLFTEAHWASSCKEGPLGTQSWHHPRPPGLLPSPQLCRLLTVLLGVQVVEPCPPPSPPLTMLLRVQAVKAVGTQENVGLALQGFAKGVAALGYHVVEDTARGEDVHRVGLKRNEGRQMPWRVGELFSPSSRGGGVGRTPRRCLGRISGWGAAARRRAGCKELGSGANVWDAGSATGPRKSAGHSAPQHSQP